MTGVFIDLSGDNGTRHINERIESIRRVTVERATPATVVRLPRKRAMLEALARRTIQRVRACRGRRRLLAGLTGSRSAPSGMAVGATRPRTHADSMSHPIASSVDQAAPDLVVVLSSYNGDKFISEQIESIRRQTWTRWTLMVRDDGSTDDTVATVDRIARQDHRIVRLPDARGQLGPAESFGVLLEHALASGAAYVAISDQDDVWHPDKLERELRVLLAREAAIGPDVPLLVHSDLTVVREDLGVIHPSFLSFQGIGHVGDVPLRKLLVQNFVTGCTTVVNRALLRLAVPFPAVVMHDWWLALCAGALGEILFLPESTLLYRQHGANAVGAKGFGRACMEFVTRPLTWWHRSGVLFGAALAQAQELSQRVEAAGRAGAALPAAADLVREYSEAYRASGVWRRVRSVRRCGILPRSRLSFPVAYYARVLLWSGSGEPASRARSSTHLRGQS